MAQNLLHGTLNLTIYEVDKIQFIGSKSDVTGLYATIDLDKTQVGSTRVIENQYENPKWNQSFYIYLAHNTSEFIFSVKEANPRATLIGKAIMPVEEALGGKEIDRWIQLLDQDKNPISGYSKIHVKLQYSHVSKDSNWDQGIKDPNFIGVPYTFFPERQGCKVSLYQDAHVPDSFAPIIPLTKGKFYTQHRCWEDVFDAINNAKHLIYINDWAFYSEITLVRDPRRPKPGGDVTLGELLKKKANEGVTVLVLIWMDVTIPFITNGLSGTHGDETVAYFAGTKVHCVMIPRLPNKEESAIGAASTVIMFSQHQKTITVDSELPSEGSNKRRIVSFVGGLDPTNGRYDTQFHSLFRTLNTVHHDDFYNICFKGASIKKGGPRQPWHDIYSRLEGHIAWDVLVNFEQRWRKIDETEKRDLLVPLKDLQDVIIPPSAITSPDDHETWNVQLFRSIVGADVDGFPQTPEEAAKVGLLMEKYSIIERSIQDAYINAIRRAKNFIYIENQFFIGSSYAWSADGIKPEDIGASHLIPKELSLKIVSKIEAKERFSVYIVIPMFPEGIPDSAAQQAMLDWQRRTMEMMYRDVTEALKAKGIKEDPRNYLAFFCLGNREVKKQGEYVPPNKPNPDSDYMKAQKARRFMIYVHAKMMIVDDEYIIVGSANLNQRSMDGSRDSEIAMGAYQPYHLAIGQPAKGQIHGFRMSLWYEHLGLLDDSFYHLESEECIKKVNHIANDYWKLYTSESLEQDLPGQLLPYPIQISNNGTIKVLPGFEFFPDTEAPVLGDKSFFIPPIITT